MGEETYAEKPGDIYKLDIAAGQSEYIQLLATYGKPIVLVLFEGRPRLLNGVFKHALRECSK
jgi:beta-glucosidase